MASSEDVLVPRSIGCPPHLCFTLLDQRSGLFIGHSFHGPHVPGRGIYPLYLAPEPLYFWHWLSRSAGPSFYIQAAYSRGCFRHSNMFRPRSAPYFVETREEVYSNIPASPHLTSCRFDELGLESFDFVLTAMKRTNDAAASFMLQSSVPANTSAISRYLSIDSNGQLRMLPSEDAALELMRQCVPCQDDHLRTPAQSACIL